MEQTMFYTCEDCHYTFLHDGEAVACTDCGHGNIRPADDEEIRDWYLYRAEFSRAHWGDCETTPAELAG